MVTILCVLRSGGLYDASWVGKLARGVARNLTVPHRFVCLSDVEVPCERIALKHNWPGWWSKIELFAPGTVTGPAIYFDLDTIITGNIDALARLPYDFSMLRGFGRTHYIGSGVMCFRKPQHAVYARFLEQPEAFMREYAANPTNKHQAFNAHRGDQAFIYDTLGEQGITRFTDAVPGMVLLYPAHLNSHVPDGCSVVCFKGAMKPPDAMIHDWARKNWS